VRKQLVITCEIPKKKDASSYQQQQAVAGYEKQGTSERVLRSVASLSSHQFFFIDEIVVGIEACYKGKCSLGLLLLILGELDHPTAPLEA